MSKKISFVFCMAVGMFLCGLAASGDNGTYITLQPSVAFTLLIGICCAFTGSLLLRTLDPRDWAGKGFAATIVALITAVTYLSGNVWIGALDFALFMATTIWVIRRQVPQVQVAA